MKFGFSMLGVCAPPGVRAPVVSIGGGPSSAAGGNFESEDYEIGGSPATYDDVFTTSFGYESYGGPFVVTPGVGVVTSAAPVDPEHTMETNLADTLDPAVGDQFLGGYVAIVEARIEQGEPYVGNGFTNFVSGTIIGEISDETTRDSQWSWRLDVWNDEVNEMHAFISVSDFDSAYEEIEIDYPTDGRFKVAVHMSPAGMAISCNGSAPIIATPVQLNAGANCVGFRLPNTATNWSQTVTLSSIELFLPDAYEIADLDTLSTRDDLPADGDTRTILDFVTRTARVDGDPVALNGTMGNAIDGGVSMVPYHWFSMYGMKPEEGNDMAEGVIFKGAVKDKLLGASTMVLDFTLDLFLSLQHAIIYDLIDSYDSYSEGQSIFLVTPNDGVWSSQEANISTWTADEGPEDDIAFFSEAFPIRDGANRLVVRRNVDGSLSASLNGGPVVTTGDITTAQTDVSLYNNDFDGGGGHVNPHYKRMTILTTLMTDGQMVAASTPAGNGAVWTE